MTHGYCKICGFEFTSNKPTEYCKMHRPPQVKACEMCGNEFEYRHFLAKYCADCNKELARQRNKAYRTKIKLREKAKKKTKKPLSPKSKKPLTLGECSIIDAAYHLNYGQAEAKGLHTREILNQVKKREAIR